MNAKHLTAREYLRVSLDRSSRGRSISEQHHDNDKAANAWGWTLGEPYAADNSVSASRYSTKTRDDFHRLLSDLENGRFGADVLMLWESSRGSRKVGEWVELIELCEKRGVLIHVTTHGRTYDPSNGRDRRSLLEDAVDSEYESSKVSNRTTRSAASNAEAGMPHGRIPYGYRRRFNEKTKQLIAQEPDADEAPVIRELFDRLAKEHSLRSIEKDFQRRGIRARSGVVMTARQLRLLAVNPVYIGKRLHIAGRHSGTRKPGQGVLYDGVWEPIVDKQTFYAVQRILQAPERKTTRPGRGVHLLSMIGRCGVCGGPLSARHGRGREWEYQCHTGGHVRVDEATLDSYAQDAILTYLTDPEVYASLAWEDSNDEEIGIIRGELAELRARADELADAVANGSMSVALAAKAEEKIRGQIDALEVREQELSTPSALHSLLLGDPGADVAQRWEDAPMSTRRAVARLLLATDRLGELRVQRNPIRGHRVDVAERVTWLRESQGACPPPVAADTVGATT